MPHHTVSLPQCFRHRGRVIGSTNPGSVVFQVAAFILDRVWVAQLSQKLDLLDDVLPLLSKAKSDTQVTYFKYNQSNT